MAKDSPPRNESSRLSSLAAIQALTSLNYPAPQIEQIQNVITEHSYSRNLPPSSIESAILQDADKLDALGAVGIWRTVSCGARMNASYYDLQDPAANARSLDDRKFTLDHFENKLFKLPFRMNTEEGRKMADQPVHFMRTFLTQLRNEIAVPDFSCHPRGP